MILKEVSARKIKTCTGKYTIEATVNKKYKASVPLGTSTGKNEIRPFPRQGIDFCIEYINKSKSLAGLHFDKFDDLKQLEEEHKMIIGNSMLAIEFAILKAMSNNEIFRLLNSHADMMPIPLGNAIGGGAHFKGNAADFQEFLLVPESKSFSENAFANEYIHRQIGRKYPNAKKTIEGAYALGFNNIRALDILKKINEKTSRELGFNIGIGIDVAPSSFYKNGSYNYKSYSYNENKKRLNKTEQIKFINKISKDYELKYVEDPLQENGMHEHQEIESSNRKNKCCHNKAKPNRLFGKDGGIS
ncbi:hypothetical protein J4231_03110 [Candidatus Woesearchaeota archaeon]|nr:hypothetical protein [Candidatus Woesearchaeota archaeon]